jgi:methylenetetrahydrofolate reductase (NADPH)
LRARLGREWTITVEVVTPPPDDAAARARILALADALRDDARVAALTLTDRTASPRADPVALAPDVADHAGAAPLVHLAGKARATRDLEDALRRCVAAGVGSVLLTGGDPLDSRAPGLRPPARAPDPPPPARSDAAVRSTAQASLDSLEMLRLAVARAPQLTRLAVAAPPRSVRGPVSRELVVAKRSAGADAFVAQVSWDLSEREIVADWQTRLGAPILGAVILLTPGRLQYLAAHRITGIVVPPALRARVAVETRADALRRVALDLVLLRRLGYAGAHVSGFLTPALLTTVLSEAERIEATVGDDWREAWLAVT